MTLEQKTLEVLVEMRDLLRLLAEPAIAERDKARRDALRTIAGVGPTKKAKAILCMDGTRTQAMIVKECAIDQGQLSNLVKKLNGAGLLVGESKQPHLAISIPAQFFEKGGESD